MYSSSPLAGSSPELSPRISDAVASHVIRSSESSLTDRDLWASGSVEPLQSPSKRYSGPYDQATDALIRIFRENKHNEPTAAPIANANPSQSPPFSPSVSASVPSADYMTLLSKVIDDGETNKTNQINTAEHTAEQKNQKKAAKPLKSALKGHSTKGLKDIVHIPGYIAAAAAAAVSGPTTPANQTHAQEKSHPSTELASIRPLGAVSSYVSVAPHSRPQSHISTRPGSSVSSVPSLPSRSTAKPTLAAATPSYPPLTASEAAEREEFMKGQMANQRQHLSQWLESIQSRLKQVEKSNLIGFSASQLPSPVNKKPIASPAEKSFSDFAQSSPVSSSVRFSPSASSSPLATPTLPSSVLATPAGHSSAASPLPQSDSSLSDLITEQPNQSSQSALVTSTPQPSNRPTGSKSPFLRARSTFTFSSSDSHHHDHSHSHTPNGQQSDQSKSPSSDAEPDDPHDSDFPQRSPLPHYQRLNDSMAISGPGRTAASTDKMVLDADGKLTSIAALEARAAKLEREYRRKANLTAYEEFISDSKRSFHDSIMRSRPGHFQNDWSGMTEEQGELIRFDPLKSSIRAGNGQNIGSSKPEIAAEGDEQLHPTVSAEPLTPRSRYSEKLTITSRNLVSLLMQLDQSAMTALRTEFLRHPRGLNMYEFILTCLTHIRSCQGTTDEMQALMELFREIDVNGDELVDFEELTSHLASLASTYDSAHSQLPHYNPTEIEDHSHHSRPIDFLAYSSSIHKFFAVERNSRRITLFTMDFKPLRRLNAHKSPILAVEISDKHGYLLTASQDKQILFHEFSSDPGKTKEKAALKRRQMEKRKIKLKQQQLKQKQKQKQKQKSRRMSQSPAHRGKERDQVEEKEISEASEEEDDNGLDADSLDLTLDTKVKNTSKSKDSDDETAETAGLLNQDDIYLSSSPVMSWTLKHSATALKSHPHYGLFVADTALSITLYHIERADEKATFQGHSDLIMNLLVIGNMNLLASASLDCTIKLWDLNKRSNPWQEADSNSGTATPNAASSACWLTLKAHTKGILHLAYHSEMRFLVSGGLESVVHIWNPRVPQPIGSISVGNPGSQCIGLEILPGSPELVTANQWGEFFVFDMRSFQPIQQFTVPNSALANGLSSGIGAGFPGVVASKGRKDAKTGKLLGPSKAVHPDPNDQSETVDVELSHSLNTLCLIPQHGLLLAAGHQFHSFFRSTGVKSDRADDTAVKFACFHPERLSFLTVSHSNLKIWNSLTGRLEKEEKQFIGDDIITSVTLDDRQRRIYIGTHSGLIVSLNHSTGSILGKISPHTSEVAGLIYCANQSTVVSIGWDGLVCLLDEKLEGIIRSVKAHEKDGLLIQSTPLYRLIATAAADQTIALFDDLLGPILHRWTIEAVPTAMCFLDPYPILLVADSNGSLHAFDCLPPWNRRPFVTFFRANLNPIADDIPLHSAAAVSSEADKSNPASSASSPKHSKSHQILSHLSAVNAFASMKTPRKSPLSLISSPTNQEIPHIDSPDYVAFPSSLPKVPPPVAGPKTRPAAVLQMKFLPSTYHLLTSDESGYVKCWPMHRTILRKFPLLNAGGASNNTAGGSSITPSIRTIASPRAADSPVSGGLQVTISPPDLASSSAGPAIRIVPPSPSSSFPSLSVQVEAATPRPTVPVPLSAASQGYNPFLPSFTFRPANSPRGGSTSPFHSHNGANSHVSSRSLINSFANISTPTANAANPYSSALDSDERDSPVPGLANSSSLNPTDLMQRSMSWNRGLSLSVTSATSGPAPTNSGSTLPSDPILFSIVTQLKPERLKSWHSRDSQIAQREFQPLLILRAHQESCIGCEFIADSIPSGSILTYSIDGTVHLWQFDTGQRLGTLQQGHNVRQTKRSELDPWLWHYHLVQHKMQELEYVAHSLIEPESRNKPDNQTEKRLVTVPGQEKKENAMVKKTKKVAIHDEKENEKDYGSDQELDEEKEELGSDVDLDSSVEHKEKTFLTGVSSGFGRETDNRDGNANDSAMEENRAELSQRSRSMATPRTDGESKDNSGVDQSDDLHSHAPSALNISSSSAKSTPSKGIRIRNRLDQFVGLRKMLAHSMSALAVQREREVLSTFSPTATGSNTNGKHGASESAAADYIPKSKSEAARREKEEKKQWRNQLDVQRKKLRIGSQNNQGGKRGTAAAAGDKKGSVASAGFGDVSIPGLFDAAETEAMGLGKHSTYSNRFGDEVEALLWDDDDDDDEMDAIGSGKRRGRGASGSSWKRLEHDRMLKSSSFARLLPYTPLITLAPAKTDSSSRAHSASGSSTTTPGKSKGKLLKLSESMSKLHIDANDSFSSSGAQSSNSRPISSSSTPLRGGVLQLSRHSIRLTPAQYQAAERVEITAKRVLPAKYLKAVHSLPELPAYIKESDELNFDVQIEKLKQKHQPTL